MLRIVTGPFHPTLERALVETVTQLKAADPLAPLTIVVPSASLRQRLKWLFCVEHKRALLDVRFLTFYQFAVRLLQEEDSFDSVAVCTPFFFQELVHHLLRRCPDTSQWRGLREMPGAWGALAATLRDLKDAAVDADRVLDAFDQTPRELQTSTQALLSLYREYVAARRRLEAYDEDDLAVFAKERVLTSPFLARQRRILYYGFYDLTQVQLDLFQTVSRAYLTTLYFPLVAGHPAYGFAERFFERYLYGLTGKETDMVSTTADQPRRALTGLFHPAPSFPVGHGNGGPGPRSRVISVAGRRDEVTVVAKEILGLVEERGYAFHQIGVVARTLAGYESEVPRIFAEHGIPVTTSMGRSMAAFPFIKTVMQLLEIRESGFRRDLVIAFFSSPFVRLQAFASSGTRCRTDLWDLASRRLGITKGVDEWRRLTRFLDHDLPLRDFDDHDALGPRIPAQQITLLWQTIHALVDGLQDMPDAATWCEYTEHLEALSAQWLDPYGGGASGDSADADLSSRLIQAFSDLRQCESLEPAVTLADFAAAFRRLMEEWLVPIAPEPGAGVRVFDAMAARGIPFRALFVLGLNDKVFPRHIQEDAFLRDHARRVFEVDLGFKIPEKLAGYDEETLLFYLLCNSAQEELTLLYQRADDAGRPLVPSGYLAEVKRLLGEGEMTLPRRMRTKFQTAPEYRAERLTQRELSLKLLLDRRAPCRLLTETHPTGAFIERGLHALRQHEREESVLGPYDGITGPLDAHWERMTTRGVSASALQHYATCPFRYYAQHVLRLEALTLPEGVDQVGPADLGTLAHNILRTCLDTLRAQGYFAASHASLDPMTVLERAAHIEFDRYADSHPVGYPLVWELHQEDLLGFLKGILRDDLAEMAQQGWEPILFETDMAGSVAVELSERSTTFPVVGRLDRVDWSRAHNAYRIIDYKFKTGGKPLALDTNLIRGAVRGRRLQPPLYLMIAQANVPAHIPDGRLPVTCEGAWFYYLAPKWEQPLTRVPFPGDAWTSELRAPLTRTLSQVLGGIQGGQFFLFDETTECERCDYRLLCRRTHQSTARRARADHRLLRPYRELRRADVLEREDDGARADQRGVPPDSPIPPAEPES